MTNRSSIRQRGAVSIFVVIFAALLITVVTLSFSRNMIREQQQAIAVDLSQSALDSAQAGVEDAKRVLLKWQDACMKGDPQCVQLSSVMGGGECNTVARILYGQSPATNMDETKVVQQFGSSDDEKLDQAYTCVTIDTKTDNYQGKLEAEESKLIRLRAVGRFDHIRLSWFTERDLDSGSTADLGGSIELPNANQWGANKPPLMRTQLIKMDDTFTLEDFDGDGSKTLYLYPNNAGPSILNFDTDARFAEKSIDSVECDETLGGSGLYFCSAVVRVAGGINVNSGEDAFLRLVSHYNAAEYQVELYNGPPGTPGSTLVQFDGVQPMVDSTGRANDLFRRVVSRIELVDPTFPYPDAAVSTGGDFCKLFTVTSRTSEYNPGASCDPRPSSP